MDAHPSQQPAEIIFCPACGQHLDARAIYCPRCGRPVFPPAPPTAAESPLSLPLGWGAQVPPPAPWQGAPGPDQPPPQPQVPTPASPALPSPYGVWPGQPQPQSAEAASEPPAPGPWTPAGAPTAYPQMGPTPPPYPYALPNSTAPYGYAGYAAPTYATPTVLAPPPVAAPRKRRVGCMLGSISVVLVVALLLASGLVLYNVLANSDAVAARYVPANTVFYASIDLVAVQLNHHGVSANTVNRSSDQGRQFQQATCLDYQSDIVPWLGRDIAAAVFPRPAPSATGTDTMGTNPTSNLGYAALIQSHDDSASQAAVRKVVACQQQKGSSLAQAVYGGLTMYTLSDAQSGRVSGAFVAGNGWVVLASDDNAARAIVDRLDGKADTLAAAPAFLDATRDLPANRFGTLYVNLRQVLASVSGATGNSLDVPFADLYPTAAGYLAWTDPGVRAQVTLKAARSLGLGTLSGDTTSLASLVPSNALVYEGIGNLGAQAQEAPKFFGSQAATADPLQSLFGVSLSDPALQQPAGLAVLRGPDGTSSAPGAVVLLHAPDPAAVASLLRTAAQTSGWTLKPTTVAGVSATAIFSSSAGLLSPQYAPPAPGAQPGTAAPPGTATPSAPTAPQYQIGVAAQVGETFVIASSTADLTAVINTAQGTAAGGALAQNATFHQLVAQAPSGAASMSFVDIAGFQNLVSAATPASPSTPTVNAGPQTTAILVTTVWNDQDAQVTVDCKLDR